MGGVNLISEMSEKVKVSTHCSIIFSGGKDIHKLSSYLHFIGEQKFQPDYELIVINNQGLPVDENKLKLFLPSVKVLSSDCRLSEQQLFDRAATAASGKFLLFIKGLIKFDKLVLQEAVNDLETSGGKMSVSANGNFVLAVRSFHLSKINLDGNGERVDIFYSGNIKFDELDKYQKSHYRRYEYAKSIILPGKVVGDFACGTGYGSIMLAEKSSRVISVDIAQDVIEQIKVRYRNVKNVEFVYANILDLGYQSLFDYIVSFETVEHLKENEIHKLFEVFSRALKPGGTLIFSTPYLQEKNEQAINMGFHSTFNINESKIGQWLSENGFSPELFKYQNYQTHNIEDRIDKKDFIICVARSCKNAVPQKQMPKVSIIIPTFNRSNYLKMAIDSALSQTYPDIEVLVLDDCSTDQTANLARAYSNVKNLRFITNEQNIGFVQNWNKGVSLASGEYIKILGDDDILDNNCIAEQVKILNEHPDVGVVCCNYFIIDENNNLKSDDKPYRLFGQDTKESGQEFIKQYLLGKRRVGWPTAMLFRKNDIRQTGDFDSRAGCAADIDMWCRILRCKNFYYLDKALAFNRRFSGNLSTQLESDQFGYRNILYFYLKTVPYIEHILDEAANRQIWSCLVEKILPFHARATAENKKIIEQDINSITEKSHCNQKKNEQCGKKNIIALIFSNDRAMQLQATIESFLLHCGDKEAADIVVLFKASSPLHQKQYDELKMKFPTVAFVEETDFRQQVLSLVERCKYVLFLVDDNIFVKPFSLKDVVAALDSGKKAIGFSLRLGKNTNFCYMLNSRQKLPAFGRVRKEILGYCWPGAEFDFGYPLEVSSSVYRSNDILRLLSRLEFSNPNTLESGMSQNSRTFASMAPVLLTFEESVTFCNPVNIVQRVYENNKFGTTRRYTTEQLADCFSRGMVIDVQRYIGFTPDSAHQEVELYFKTAGQPIPETLADRTSHVHRDKPKFSIVMANYNNSRYISQAIESVLGQTFKDWELIIVDDCSTDGSVDIINRFLSDDHIRLIRHDANKGYIAALKTAIAAVGSDMFGILDSDDFLMTQAVETMYKHHIQSPDCGLIYSQFIHCDENLRSKQLGFCRAIPAGKTTLDMQAVSHFKTFKLQDYLKTPGFDESMLYAEDKDIIYKMEEVTRLKFVNECLYLYRELPNSQSHDARKAAIGLESVKRAKSASLQRREQTYKAAAFLTSNQLSIVHINTQDLGGGAAKVAWTLKESLKEKGHISQMFVGKKDSDATDVCLITDQDTKSAAETGKRTGLLYYDINSTFKLASNPDFTGCDIFHFHNLHGDYFNFFALPELTKIKPCVWTLHDMQSLTGHCAHSFECERWKTGCGNCQHLDIDPMVLRDQTAQVWKDKQQIYSESDITVVVPSNWLKTKVEQGLLKDKRVELIYNGIDTRIFKPGDKINARQKLGLPLEGTILAFTAHGGMDSYWRDGKGLAQAISYLSTKHKDVFFLNIGHNSNSFAVPNTINVPYVTDQRMLACIYTAVDMFIFPSLADNCPLSVIEAMACGLPVISYKIGGIPELVCDGKTGILAEYKNVPQLIAATELLIVDKQKRYEMSIASVNRVREKFTLDRMVESYLEIYQELRKRVKVNTHVCAAPRITKKAKQEYPKISIVTPSFNQAKSLEKVLDTDKVEVIEVGNLNKGEHPLAQSSSMSLSKTDCRVFSYSKKSHFELFKGYDTELYAGAVDPDNCDLKNYQDLLVLLFIRENIPKGSRILDIGGGDSRILKHLKDEYECWNLDKLEGRGSGPASIDSTGYRLVKDYIGNFNKELPDNYFDFVFSVSALEHVPDDNQDYLGNIRDDIERILKPGGYSLHCFDVVIKKDSVWTNKLLPFLCQNLKMITPFVPLEELERDPDLYVMTEKAYQKGWQSITKKTYLDFGKPLSYNVLWQKMPSPLIKTSGIIGRFDKTNVPKISVVTPSFNQAEYLEECIDSILGQNYPNLEYVIMDGGSTDGSVEIIKKYAKYLSYWQSRPDGGQYAAINEGFKRATGEIMTWLNSDDKYHTDSLFKAAHVFGKYPDIEWITGRPTAWNEKGKLILVSDELPLWSREKYLNRTFKDHYIQQESTFWKRTLWDKAGGRLELHLQFAGDLELWMRFFRHARLFTVDALLGGYRYQHKQKTNLCMDKYIQEGNQIIDHELADIKKGKFTMMMPAPKPVSFNEMEFQEHKRKIVSTDIPDSRREYGLQPQKGIGLTVATSIAPSQLAKQVNAIESWIKLGFDVVSINGKEEIETLKGAFPNVRFIQAKRDARNILGRPFVYFDDILEYLKQTDSEICGIVNSDIYLSGDENVVSFIRSQAKNSLVYGARTEVDSLENLSGQVYQKGFDFFFFDKSLISHFPKSDFCIGATWWDYWMPVILVLAGCPVKKLVSPFAYHVRHPYKWDEKQWFLMGVKLYGYLRERICEKIASKSLTGHWDLLARMISTYFHLFIKKTGSVQNKDEHTKIMYQCGGHCILEFLGIESQPIDQTGRQRAKSPNADDYADSDITVGISFEDYQKAGEEIASGCEVSLGTAAGTIPSVQPQTADPQSKYLVTAIVSAYNSERFMRSCLDDLERQTIADRLEIIVVNSGSQQNEDVIIKEFQQRYDNIVYIKTEHREGIYSAWNRAVKAARGQFLTNANTDDRHSKDAYEIMVKTFLDNPDVALVYGDQIKTDTPNDTFENNYGVEKLQRPEYSHERLLFGCCVGSQPMWRKSLHDELGLFDESLTCAGDWDFWLRISKKYKFKRIPQFLGLYYYNEDGVEHGTKIHSLYERYIVGKRYGNPYISVIPIYKNNQNPLVSIIMPAYNAGRFIARAIESALIQNYRNFEIVVVDDGSTDNTKEILQKFNDPGIRYIALEKNQGVSHARNVAVQQARGEFIISLDADDMLMPDFISRHLIEFEKHPDTDMIYCDDLLIDENDKPIREIKRQNYRNCKSLIGDLFRYGFPIVHCRHFVRRNIFDRIGLYDESLIIGEDYDLMRKFVKEGLKFYHLPENLCLRRVVDSSLSRKFSAEKAKSHFDVVKRYSDTFACEELFPDVDWNKIAPEKRKLQAKCLSAVTCFTIGQSYVKTAPVYAKTAFDQACSELDECFRMDPANPHVQQLLKKCEAIRTQCEQAVQEAVY